MAQPSAGDIRITDRTEIPTELPGIFKNEKSAVFCRETTLVNFIIEHDQNYRLDCDPDPATPAGIRYLLLNKKEPTEPIRDLSAVLRLPLHRMNGEVVVLGSGVAEDLIIREDMLPALGLERPFEVWIVPFISHNIHSETFEGHFESSDQCLDVNLGTAISLTALHMIHMLFRPTNLDEEGYFEILYNEVWGTGGLPELYPEKDYRVSMIDTDTGDTMTIIRTGNDKERFKPQKSSGEFFIYVNDSLGCESGGLGGLDFRQPTIQLYSRDDFANQGDIRCMPVYVDNFFDLDEFGIQIDWNPSDLGMTGISDIHPLLSSGLFDIDSSMASSGSLDFSWSDLIHNFKLIPGTKLFDVCYRVLAGPGTRTEITFHRADTYFDTGYFLSEWNDSAGAITVGPDSWNVVRDYTYCYSGRDSVDIIFYTLGQYPPFTMEIPEAGITKIGLRGNEIFIEDLPVGEYSYRLTDSLGNTHFVAKAFSIPPGSPPVLTLQSAIPPDCGAQDGLIKLETIEFPYQNIRMTGPGQDETYPPKNLFEDLSSGMYTFTTYDVNDCPGEPLSVHLSGESELDISVEMQELACEDSLATVVLNVFNESMQEVNTSILFDNDLIITPGTPIVYSPGTYSVEINDPDYCEVMREITIPEVAAPNSVMLSIANAEIKPGKPFEVMAEYKNPAHIVSHAWSPSQAIQQGDEGEATFILDGSSWIAITSTDDGGCTYSDSIFINVSEEVQPNEESLLYLPNTFTPNGDGHNDQLKIFTRDGFLAVEDVHIYDRYGNNLFWSAGPFPDRILWDGRVDGNVIAPGVYVVQLKIRKSDESVMQIIETVTILR